MTKIYPNSVDMTDAEDLASEKRNVADALANLRKQRQQYWDKKYKNFGGSFLAKAGIAVGDIGYVLLLMAIGGLIAFYLLSHKNETSDIIYFSCPDSDVTKLILPQELPKTGADLF